MARIRLKYVNSFANPDRKNGAVRHYFRKRGLKDRSRRAHAPNNAKPEPMKSQALFLFVM